MVTEIPDGIRDLIERGAAPVTAAEATARADFQRTAPRRTRPGLRRRIGLAGPSRARRIAVVAAAVTAAACAVAIVATGVTGPTTDSKARPTIILTAATVRHLVTQSRAALANSGRAVITYRQLQDSVLQQSGTDDITFSGQNWNDAFSVTLPATGKIPANTEFAINRIVNGQAYYYIAGRTSKLEWYHDTNPTNHPDIAVPDPRTVLDALAPSARFELLGYQTVGGVRLEHLRATRSVRLAGLAKMPDVQPGDRITGLQVWADGHGVVRRMTLSLRQVNVVRPFTFNPRTLPTQLKRELANGRTITVNKIQALIRAYARHQPALTGGGRAQRQVVLTTLTVSFLDIGQPEVITPPRHAIQQFGLG
jgi:hypothetical protein